MKFHVAFLVAAFAAGQEAEVGSRACAGCHAEIFAKYQRTGMAQSAGPVGSGGLHESFAQAAFTDSGSGASYAIDAGYQLKFSRNGIDG